MCYIKQSIYNYILLFDWNGNERCALILQVRTCNQQLSGFKVCIRILFLAFFIRTTSDMLVCPRCSNLIVVTSFIHLTEFKIYPFFNHSTDHVTDLYGLMSTERV